MVFCEKKGEYLLDQLNIPLLVYTLNLLKNRQNHDLNINIGVHVRIVLT